MSRLVFLWSGVAFGAALGMMFMGEAYELLTVPWSWSVITGLLLCGIGLGLAGIALADEESN